MWKLCLVLLFFRLMNHHHHQLVDSATNPTDLQVLNDFKKCLSNHQIVGWVDDDPCGPPSWPNISCSNDGRVTRIEIQHSILQGCLPQNINKLSMLSHLLLEGNRLYGDLPSLSGMSNLQIVHLGNNAFDTIPYDFFNALPNLRDLSLDYNPLNATTGWSMPDNFSHQLPHLTSLSLIQCNLLGPLPDYLGKLPSLTQLKLSFNRISGGIPTSLGQSRLQILWLNNQVDPRGGMTGPIDVITEMVSLTQLRLGGNKFSGTIPDKIGALRELTVLDLKKNQFVGLVPLSLANMELQELDLDSNNLMGPLPIFKTGNASFAYNGFCQPFPGFQCAPDVKVLLDFLRAINYPLKLVSKWSGSNQPCKESWWGLNCNIYSEVSGINLEWLKLNGTLSPSIVNLRSLVEVKLQGNRLNGIVPANLTLLKSLRLLDLRRNNFTPPLPNFCNTVTVLTGGNPLLMGKRISIFAPIEKPLTASLSQLNNTSSGMPSKNYTRNAILFAIAAFVFIFMMAVSSVCLYKKRNGTSGDPSAIVVLPRYPSDSEEMIQIGASNNITGSLYPQSVMSCSGEENSPLIEIGNLVIPFQVLSKITKNFGRENELGHGGFGTVYKGEMEDGLTIAVKRMEARLITNKALNQFHAEISVLSMVRHKHLVCLLGYSTEGNERLLVYEYMSKGPLSKHLFHWNSLNMEPLSLTRRLSIALDVARGLEYLHHLARERFIHRDLKPSNILLGDDYRAKISDFGLVKLAQERENSVTKPNGTFGYLAPEYAVMGQITTKADVYSYGVVLLELLTGMTALDDDRPEENRYLVDWFWQNKWNKEKLIDAIDPALEVTEETFESIYVLAELAGHCTTKELGHRPDMSYVVSKLASLVEKWQPADEEEEHYLHPPLM